MAAFSHSFVSATPSQSLSRCTSKFALFGKSLSSPKHRSSCSALASIVSSLQKKTKTITSESDEGSRINNVLDSFMVICTSAALSFALFITDVDPASAFVVNPPRKLQSDELATVRLFQENTPSVVYITNLAAKYAALKLSLQWL